MRSPAAHATSRAHVDHGAGWRVSNVGEMEARAGFPQTRFSAGLGWLTRKKAHMEARGLQAPVSNQSDPLLFAVMKGVCGRSAGGISRNNSIKQFEPTASASGVGMPNLRDMRLCDSQGLRHMRKTAGRTAILASGHYEAVATLIVYAITESHARQNLAGGGA